MSEKRGQLSLFLPPVPKISSPLTTKEGLILRLSIPRMTCWFARDVTAAMLVVKNKSVSLLWELNSISCKLFEKIFCCIDHQDGRLVTWLETKNRRAALFTLIPRNKTYSEKISILLGVNSDTLCCFVAAHFLFSYFSILKYLTMFPHKKNKSNFTYCKIKFTTNGHTLALVSSILSKPFLSLLAASPSSFLFS